MIVSGFLWVFFLLFNILNSRKIPIKFYSVKPCLFIFLGDLRLNVLILSLFLSVSISFILSIYLFICLFVCLFRSHQADFSKHGRLKCKVAIKDGRTTNLRLFVNLLF